jgi:hypothetical protein
VARTFKDAPLKVRLERGEVYFVGRTTVGATSYKERGFGRRGLKTAKRLAGKRRRQNCTNVKALRELDFTTVWCSD